MTPQDFFRQKKEFLGLLAFWVVSEVLNVYHQYLKRVYKSNGYFLSGGNTRSPDDQLRKHGEKQTPGEKAHFALLPTVPLFRIATWRFKPFINRMSV